MSFWRFSKKEKNELTAEQSRNKKIDFNRLPSLLTLEQVSEILGVHPNTLRNWDAKGRLTAVRLGPRKDRRYEKEAIRTFRQKTLKQLVAEQTYKSKPKEKSYIITSGLSWHNFKLFFISKKFSVFVYSVAVVGFAFFTIQATFFAYMYSARAEEEPVNQLTVEPGACTGWGNPSLAGHIEGLATSALTDFSEKNSAFYTNSPAVSLENMNAPLNLLDNRLNCSGYQIKDKLSDGSTLRGARLVVSLGAQTYASNEDVLSLAYTVDGTNWWPLESLALTEEISNARHEGYYSYPLEQVKTLNDLKTLSFRAEFNAAAPAETATVYLDGADLELDIQKPADKIKQEIAASVQLGKKDLQANESQQIAVEIAEQSAFAFLGADPTTRQVQAVTVTDPLGQAIKTDIEVKTTASDKITVADYTIPTDNFKHPGKYTVTLAIEQAGVLTEVKEDFSWGVLALNPDQSTYKKSDTAIFSIGALDEHGSIVCNADVTLTITDPAGKKTIKRTADKTIETTDFCGKKELYQKPDMIASEKLNRSGTYRLDLTATVNGNTSTLSDTLIVEDKPAYTIERIGPTRVFPNIYQPMKLKVTVLDDFQGTIRELAPGAFALKPENGGQEKPFDTGTEIIRSLVWEVNLKAGSTVTLGYTFKSPEKSPALFNLGPARVGDWQEHRTWQLAIDPAYMYLMATSNSAATGWTNQTTYDGASARFLRAAATYGGTGGAATHSSTVSGTATVNATTSGITDTCSCVTRCESDATYAHTHTTTNPTVGAGDNNPEYHSFYLWKSNAQNPTTVPQNTFAFFKSNPGGSWTQFAAANSRLVKLTNSHTTGGSNTHTHLLTWQSIAGASGSCSTRALAGENPPGLIADTHTHTAPAPSASSPGDNIPPYVNTLIYQQTNATPQTIPNGLVGMFDADPGTGWDVISDASPYQNNFVRGYTSESGTGGASTHNHASSTSGASGANGQISADKTAGTNAAQDNHTHTITVSLTDGADHTPPYINFVLAQCTAAGGCGEAGSTLTISGTAYSSEGSGPITSQSVRLLVNGTNTACGGSACTATTNASTGAYSIANITATAGDKILIYLDTAGSYLANTALVVGSSNITDADLYQNRLIVRQDYGTSITNTNIQDARGSYSDTDIIYSGTSPALTVNSGIELHVWGGKTYDPNGTVTTQGTGDLHVDDNAYAYLDTATSVIARDALVDGGATLTIDADTTIAGGDITTSGTSATVTNASGTPTVTLSGTGSIGGGTTPSLTFYNLTLSGTPTFASSFSITHNLTLPASVTAGSTTVTMTGTAGTIVGGGATINNLTINPASAGTITLNTSSLTVSGTLNVASGDTLSIANSITLTLPTGSTLTLTGTIQGNGTLVYQTATVFPTTGTLGSSIIARFDTISNSLTMSARTDYQRVEIENSGTTGSRTVTMASGTITLASTLTVKSTGSGGVTLTGASNNPTVNVGGNFTYTASANSKTVVTGTGTWSFAATVNISNGTFTATSGNTVRFNGSSNLTTGGQSLYNVNVDGNLAMFDALTVSNNLTMTSGTLASTSQNLAVNGGSITCGASTCGAFSMSGTAAVTLSGTGNFGTAGLSPNWSFINLTFSGSSTTTTVGSGTITVTGTLTNGAGHTLNAGAKTWTLSGSGTPFVNSDVFTASTSTMQYTGTTATTVTAATYYALEVKPGANSITHTFAAGTTAITNNFTAGDGTHTGAVVAANTNSTTLDIGGSVTISANTTFQAHASNSFTVGGSWTNNGAFTHNSGTVTLDGTGQQTLSGTMTSGSAFNNLVITNAGASNPDVIFAAAATTAATFTAATAGTQIQFLAGADFTFQNIVFNGQATGTRVTLTSSTTSAWNIIVAGTRSVLNTSVSYSTASASYANIDATNASNYDAGNNTRWDFPSATISISGSANGNNGATVKVAVNGVAQAQIGTIASSTWIIAGVTTPTAGQAVTVWADNVTDANESTGVTLYSSGNITGMVLNTNILTIGAANNQSLTLTNIGAYTCSNDEDVMLGWGSSTLSLSGCTNSYSDPTFSVLASNTVTVGASETLSVHNLTNAGTLTSTTTAAYTVNGSWANSNTFTPASSTVTFNSTATGETINNGASLFYNVIFNGSGGGWSFSAATTTISYDLTVTTGTLSGSNNIGIGHSFTGNGTVNFSGGTATLSSSNGNIGGNTAWTFNNLTLDYTGACGTSYTLQATGTGQMTINGALSGNDGCYIGESYYNFDLSPGAKTWILTSSGAGNAFSLDNFGDTSTFRYTGTSNTTVSDTNYYNLELLPASGTPTYDISGGFGIYGTILTFSSSLADLTEGTSVIYIYNPVTIIGGGQTIYSLDMSNVTGTVTLSTSDLTVGGLFRLGTATFSISSGRQLTWQGTQTNFFGTVSGAGTFVVDTTTTLPTGGTISSIVRFDTSAGSTTVIPARTYGGAVEVYNNNASARTLTGPTSGTFTFSGNLTTTCSSCGGLILDLDNTTDATYNITGNLSIGASTTVQAPNSTTLSVGTNFANSGTFTHDNGTVAFNTTATSVISGNTTFYDLTTSGIGAAKTITFTAGSTQTVSHTWTVTGAAGQLVTLQSSSSPTQWNINPTAASVSYVQVSNSNNQGVSFCATYSTDTGDNNTNWHVETGSTCGITVSGVVYSDEGSSPYDCSTNNLTIGVAVNAGVTQTGTCTAVNGSFSINADYPSAAGDTVVVFIDAGETPQATTVTLTADTTSDISGQNMFVNYLVVQHENAGPIYSTDLSAGENGDTGIRYGTACGGSCSVAVSSGITLYVPIGITFNIDQNISTQGANGNVKIDGALQGTFNLGVGFGNLTGAGTVNMSGGTVSFNTYDGELSNNQNWAFYNLTFAYNSCTFEDPNYTTTATGSGTVTVSGVLTNSSCSCGLECTRTHKLSAGSKTWIMTGSGTPVVNSFNYDTSTFRFTYTGGSATTASGSFYNLELNPPSGTPVYNGGVTIYGNLYINPIVSLDSSTDVYMYGTGNTIDAGGKTFHDFWVNPPSTGTITVQNTDFTVARYFNVYGNGTLAIPQNRVVTYTGTGDIYLAGVISGLGTLRFTDTSGGPSDGGTLSSVVRYDASGGNVLNTTFDARTYGGDVEVYADTANVRSIAMASGTQQINGNFKVITGASQSEVLTLDASANPAVNIAGNLTFTKGGSATPAITSGTGIWTVTGNVNFTNGTYSATTGNTMKMNGSSTSITSASQTLQNYEVSGGSVSSADAMDVNGTFRTTGGGFTQAANANLNVAGNFTLDSGTTFTAASGTGKVIFDGDLQFKDNTVAKQNVGAVQVGTSPDTTTLTTNMVAKTLTVKSGDTLITDGYDLDIGLGGITIENTGTLNAADGTGGSSLIYTENSFSNSGTFTCGTSTLTFDGNPVSPTTQNLKTNSSPLYTLTLNEPSGNELTVELQDALDVNNTVTITNGTLDTKSGSNFSINVGNNWSNSDTFTAWSGTVTFDATGTGHTINPGSSPFYNLIFNGSGGAWSPLTNTVTVTNDLTMTNGTFNTATGTANVTVNGHVQCGASCGTINMTSTNTFTQSVSASKNFGANAGAGTNWTFYNLTFSSSANTPTVTLNSAGTGQISVNHNLSLTNSGTSLVVDNETNDRVLSVTGAVSIGSGATLQASSSANFNVSGNWTNNGNFTAGTGTVTLDGTGQQILSGQMTGVSDRFYKLTVTNASAADPDVIFSDNAETQNTFTANTASTQLQFNAASTYTFQNISFNGQASGTRVSLRSSSPSTDWNLNVAGTRSVLNTDVQDSDACGQQPYIDATGGTNLNSGRNPCWLFLGLSVSLNPTTINLGELSTTQIKQSGVTLTVSTDAISGYAAMAYYDGQMRTTTGDNMANTSGGTITTGSEEFGVSTSDSGQTITQWNPAACTNTASESNASALTASPQTFASDTTSVSGEQTTLCFLGSISPTTIAGAYATTVTIVVTGLY